VTENRRSSRWNYAFTAKSVIIDLDHHDSARRRIEALRLPIDRAAIMCGDVRKQAEVNLRSELHQWEAPGRGHDRRPVEPREQFSWMTIPLYNALN
jgi:hypothetical protein